MITPQMLLSLSELHDLFTDIDAQSADSLKLHLEYNFAGFESGKVVNSTNTLIEFTTINDGVYKMMHYLIHGEEASEKILLNR